MTSTTERPTRRPRRRCPAAAATAAGLRYVTAESLSIRRQRAGRGFRYVDVDGQPVRDPRALRRIAALAIPPAWTEVRVCSIPHGHLQAIGRDAKGRRQYRYHPRWRAVRDETKYGRMLAFGEALPRIRRQVEGDLALPGLSRQKVLATAIRLLETTFIRVGNEEYRRLNGSFGLTTLRDRHVDVDGAALRFQFRGKGGKPHVVEVVDRRLARVVKRCQALPGQELFQYVDAAGQRHSLDSADVNEYLQQITGQAFTSKDFRTWAGTVLALLTLQRCGAAPSLTQARRRVSQAIHEVALRLGNTPAVCRKCYVHPAVIEAYLDGSLARALSAATDAQTGDLGPELLPEERLALAFLRRLPPVDERDTRRTPQRRAQGRRRTKARAGR
jgi:DNA topoisomerase-1